MIRKLKLSHIAAMSIATFAATGVVSAAPGHYGKRHQKRSQTRLVQSFDFNGDGVLNRRERRALRRYKRSAEYRQYQRYSRFDYNYNGRLDRYERRMLKRWQRAQLRNRRGVVRDHRRFAPRYPTTTPPYFGKRYRGKRFGAERPSTRVTHTRARVRDHRSRRAPNTRDHRNKNTRDHRNNNRRTRRGNNARF